MNRPRWPTPAPRLNINSYIIEGVAIVELEGIVNRYSASQFRDALMDVFSTGNYRLVVDLEAMDDDDEADYISVLVGGLKSVQKKDGSLHLVCTDKRTIDTFRITGLTKNFRIYPTIEEAVKASHESQF